jgi:GT2 family glycosyltransferase
MTEKCLESVVESDDISLVHEIVFVDNNSTDRTAWHLNGLRSRSPNVQVASLTENVGFGRGSNIGANLAEGEYLFFLNNDTEVRDGWLRAQVAEMDSDIAAVAGKLLNPDGSIQHSGVDLYCQDSLLVASNTTDERPARDLDCIGAAATLHSAYAFWRVGGFDPTFRNGYEDVDLCLRYRLNGYRLRYTPDSVVMHHAHASGPERWANTQDNIARLQELWNHDVAS